jgi:hypothetical protein
VRYTSTYLNSLVRLAAEAQQQFLSKTCEAFQYFTENSSSKFINMAPNSIVTHIGTATAILEINGVNFLTDHRSLLFPSWVFTV